LLRTEAGRLEVADECAESCGDLATMLFVRLPGTLISGVATKCQAEPDR
jgi:hypothetical protein